MTSVKPCLLAALLLAPSHAYASTPQSAPDKPPQQTCNIGPLHKIYGGSPWLVYACADSRTVVIVTDAGSKASPFVFMFYPKPDGTMGMYGEGTGDKAATDAAYADLTKLSSVEVAALVAEAKTAGPHEPAISGY